MRSLLSGFLILGLVSLPQTVFAVMTSTNFQIQWDSIGFGGSEDSSSASYRLRDTIGNQGGGALSGTTYNIGAGYRQGVFDEILTFDVYGQTTSTQKSVTSVIGTNIAVDETGINSSDFVALVQNLGASQVVAVGKVSNTSPGNVEVDWWSDNGTAPVIDGTNDFLYVLGSNTLDFGTLSSTTANTSVVATEVSSDMLNGYTINVFDDGDLRSGLNTITDVSDGAVSIGSSEYGGISSDASLSGSTFDTQDTAFTESTQEIVTTNAPVFYDRSFLTLKVSIGAGQSSGTYAQQLSLVVSANY